MNPIDSQVLESYVPVYDVVPETWEDARPFLVEQLKRLATAVNIREIGWFLDEELLSGKAFIPGNNISNGETSQVFRQVLRKVIDFGPLPAAAIKSVPHGIVFDANFTLVQLWGAATNPTLFFGIPIPFVNPNNAAQTVGLYIDSTNIVITTAVDLSSYTRVFVTIEYMQEL